jgi:hypothetical protein
LSIVIPFLGDVGRLEDTLVSVLANRPADVQILVVLSAPYSDPYSLAGEVCFIEAPQGAGLAACIWQGIAASEAPIVHLLGCGREATLGWADAALERFADPQIAVVAALVVDRFETRRIISAGVQYTAGGAVRPLAAGQLPDGPPDSCGAELGADILTSFYRKAALEAVADLLDRPRGPLAGVDWALALRYAGYTAAFAPGSVIAASHDCVTAHGQWAQGMARQRLFWRWAPTRGWVHSLAAHAVVLARECLLCFIRPTLVGRLAGRCWATLQMAAYRRHWQRLSQSPEAEVHVIRPPHFLSDTARRRKAG